MIQMFYSLKYLFHLSQGNNCMMLLHSLFLVHPLYVYFGVWLYRLWHKLYTHYIFIVESPFYQHKILSSFPRLVPSALLVEAIIAFAKFSHLLLFQFFSHHSKILNILSDVGIFYCVTQIIRKMHSIYIYCYNIYLGLWCFFPFSSLF